MKMMMLSQDDVKRPKQHPLSPLESSISMPKGCIKCRRGALNAEGVHSMPKGCIKCRRGACNTVGVHSMQKGCIQF